MGTTAHAAGPQPHGVISTHAAKLAGGWLTEQFLDQVEVQSEAKGVFHDDSELTADVIIGLDAAGVGQIYAANATTTLIGELASYVGDTTHTSYVSPLAKTILVAEAQGLNPRSLAGSDLVAALEAAQDPATGRFSDKSTASGDHSNAMSQSLAVMAERRAGRPAAIIASGLRSLKSLQCGDGGFAIDYGAPDCVSDVEATSMAILAGVDQTSHTPTWANVAAAVTFLSGRQNADTGAVGGTSSENAAVTSALAAAAFAAAGVTGSATTPLSGALGAAQAVASLQFSFDDSPTEAGAVGTEDETAIAIFGLAIFDDPSAKLSYETVSHFGSGDAPVSAAPMGSFEPMRPFRLLDTRASKPIPAGSTLELYLPTRQKPADPDQGGFPEGFTAAALNVTAVTPTGPGYVSIYPSGTAQPATSVLNLVPGLTTSADALVTIGSTFFPDVISIHNGSSRPLQLILDATGFIQPGAGRASGTYRAITPTRLIDTRRTARLHAGADLAVPIDASFSSQMAAAAVAVTVVNPRGAGYLTVWGQPAYRPYTSTLNFTAGQTLTNGTIVASEGQGFEITNNSGADLDVVVDMTGYFVAGRAILPGTFVPMVPVRLVDTRQHNPIPAAGVLALGTAGVAGMPAAGVLAVAANLTAVAPTVNGFLIADPSYGVLSPPLTSTLNLVPGRTVANGFLSGVGADGAIAVYNGSTQPVNAAVDLNGYFRAVPVPPR